MFSSCEDCVVVNPKAAMIEGSQNDKPYVPMFWNVCIAVKSQS